MFILFTLVVKENVENCIFDLMNYSYVLISSVVRSMEWLPTVIENLGSLERNSKSRIVWRVLQIKYECTLIAHEELHF